MEKNGQGVSGVEQRAPLPRPLCIVIADDDRDAVLSLMMLLRDEGHQVHGAYSAQQALDAVLKYQPDALVLDIALGRSSGYDVARKIRERHGDDRPMIIGVSGIYKKGSDKILAEINGFNAYLVKPYEIKDVLELLAPLRIPRSTIAIDDTKPEDTYRAALAHAATLVGGARQLSERLRVPMPPLTRWLAGTEKPPMALFLKVIDVLLEEGKKQPSVQATSGDVIEFPKTPGGSS